MIKRTEIDFSKIKIIDARKSPKEEKHLDIYIGNTYLLRIHESQLKLISNAIEEYNGQVHEPHEYEGYSIIYKLRQGKFNLMAASRKCCIFIAKDVNRDYLEIVQYAVTNNKSIIEFCSKIINSDNVDWNKFN